MMDTMTPKPIKYTLPVRVRLGELRKVTFTFLVHPIEDARRAAIRRINKALHAPEAE